MRGDRCGIPGGHHLAGVVATVPMQCGPRNEIRTFDLSRRRGGGRLLIKNCFRVLHRVARTSIQKAFSAPA